MTVTKEMCCWINPLSGNKCEIYGTVYRDRIPITAYVTSYVGIYQTGTKRILFNLELFPKSMICQMQEQLITNGVPTGTP